MWDMSINLLFNFLTDTWDSKMSGAGLAIDPSQTLATTLCRRKGAVVTFPQGSDIGPVCGIFGFFLT